MNDTVRVYINAKPVDVAPTATALEAVDRWDSIQAAAIRSGERSITDSRGIHINADASVYDGAIFRIVRARQVAEDTDDDLL